MESEAGSCPIGQALLEVTDGGLTAVFLCSHQTQTTCWDHPRMAELYQSLGESDSSPCMTPWPLEGWRGRPETPRRSETATGATGAGPAGSGFHRL